MPVTYKKIAATTVGSGGATDITLSSIPGTYTDLLLLVSVRNTVALDVLGLQMNSVTTGYSIRMLRGSGSAAASFTESSFVSGTTKWVLGYNNAATSTFASFSIYIPNYAGSTAKSLSCDAVQEENTTTAYSSLVAGLCTSTAAITSLKLFPEANSFAQYSTATLYGISKS